MSDQATEAAVSEDNDFVELKAFQKFYDKAMSGSEEDVIGFDFSIILMALLPILLEQLQACIGKVSTEKLAGKMASGGLLVKIMTRRSLRTVLRESGEPMRLSHQGTCVDGCLRGMREEQLNKELIGEARALQWALA